MEEYLIACCGIFKYERKKGNWLVSHIAENRKCSLFFFATSVPNCLYSLQQSLDILPACIWPGSKELVLCLKVIQFNNQTICIMGIVPQIITIEWAELLSMQDNSLAFYQTFTVKWVRIMEHGAPLQRSVSIASTHTCWCRKHDGAAGERGGKHVEP